MKYEWLDEYCLSKVGSEKDFKIEWDAIRYLIAGKMFAMQGGDKYKKPIITLKCDPEFGHTLRQEYPHIVAGYYMNKEHWNSVYLDGDVPDDVLKQMIDMSFELVFKSLSKKVQSQILNSINNEI
ncbi:MmcQ/YjbR family DNA-binding protein [Clostridium sp. CS001]|uniref:MmcQ/YjbR family DNA-binding protein n=1 Tax=Clostridium sp. CS001 TaxID=2880648 RepID=UPI001CF3D315|nr:MmcQ/YjbR family DNA-binding protein [Clostridium sp. CS001]MCB2290911.1 MmcQ/YjbR family DNA-binding protein [Clostridium sp. CS001]